jgi:hypothetical protein
MLLVPACVGEPERKLNSVAEPLALTEPDVLDEDPVGASRVDDPEADLDLALLADQAPELPPQEEGYSMPEGGPEPDPWKRGDRPEGGPEPDPWKPWYAASGSSNGNKD